MDMGVSPTPTFADRLFMARRRAKLEQEELAQRVGITRYSLGRLERDQTTQIDVKVLKRLCRILQVSADWLVGMDVEESLGAEPVPDDMIIAPCI